MRPNQTFFKVPLVFLTNKKSYPYYFKIIILVVTKNYFILFFSE